MKTVDQLIAGVIAREGGYTNNPADRGGATNWGITQQVARAYGYMGEMQALPKATAAAIYRQRYWASVSGDAIAAIAPTIAAELFDTAVNMGASTAATFLQRALNVLNRGGVDYPDVPVDGQAGAVTVAALRALLVKRGSSAESVLLKALDALQGARYIGIAEADRSQEAFVYGWLANRIGQAA